MTIRSILSYITAFFAIFMTVILAVYFLQAPKLKANEFDDISKFMEISDDVDLDEIQGSIGSNSSSEKIGATEVNKENQKEQKLKVSSEKFSSVKKTNNVKQKKVDDEAQSKTISIAEPIKPLRTKASKTISNEYNRDSSLGINTNEVFEQDASIPFVDLFRVATPFNENIRCRKKDQPCLTDAKVKYDKNGWPIKLNGGKAGVFFLRNVALEALPKGNYSVLYDGEGQIEYQQNAKLVSRSNGEDTISFDARADGFMTAVAQITKSNPNNPLTNIRIIMPGGICEGSPYNHVKNKSECSSNTNGTNKTSNFLDFKTYHASIIFNPDYLNFMKDFGVIRLMPMSGITRNLDERWDQRPNMQEATWGGIYGSRGAPIEIQIALANRLQADPWLNVPHIADDNYMRQFAQYVKNNLSPNLVPHIEYTNEAWNSNFVHNEHMQKMGIAQKLDQDALLAGYKYYAKRSVEFFAIWNDIYGGQVKNGQKQFVRIIGGWDTRPDISSIILAYNDTYKSTDAIAIAPYIGGNLKGFRESKTVSDIFKLLNDKKSYRSLPKIMEELEKHAELANEFGVSLIAYEGGQGLVDWAARDYLQHPNPLFYAANRDSRMNDLYQELYKEWRGLGADLFVAFSAPRSCNWSGCWGLKENIRQELKDAPKLQASLAFMKDNKRWWSWDKKSQKVQPASSEVVKYLKPLDPNKPRIVLRPAKKGATTKNKLNYRFENPQALNLLLEGGTWDKRDMSGKWQVKWDKKYIYFSAKVYDKEISKDSNDPVNDDSIELFIDINNSRGSKFDKKNDFHFIFARNKTKVVMGKQNPKNSKANIPYEIEEKYDGYELRAKISWKALGKTPAVKNKLSMDVVMNDDDDNTADEGKRDARISWNSRKVNPRPKDFGMVLISGR